VLSAESGQAKYPPFCAVEATLIAGGGAVQNRLIWR
jgi:hypothetical protein